MQLHVLEMCSINAKLTRMAKKCGKNDEIKNSDIIINRAREGYSK